MRIDRLREVKRHILNEPLGYSQNEWCLTNHILIADIDGKVPKCGTRACIGGRAALLFAPGRDVYKVDSKKLLGITFAQGNRLFSVSGSWPEPYATQYAKANTPAERARIAVNRIEKFIRTKGKV